MGVDAKMFVRIKGREDWLAPAQVDRLAYRMAAVFGPRHFSMHVLHHALAIVEPHHGDPVREPHLEGKVVWHQFAGPPIVAAPDEQFIEAYSTSAYYAEDYESCSWPIIRAVAEWLERNIGGEVWYGGDSPDPLDRAAPLGAERRAALNEHFLAARRDEYDAALDAKFRDPPSLACDTCGVRMLHSQPEVTETYLVCPRCGRQAMVTTSGAIFWLRSG